MGVRILAVDDEEDILELLRYNLCRDGYSVETVTSGEKALEVLKLNPFDLILLDLMLPGANGLDICKSLKSNSSTAHIPVIMLTARGEEADIVAGLELGADDYITKPFSPRILLARVRAVLRRSAKKPETSILRINDLLIDNNRHEAKLAGRSLELTATQFKMLYFLASNPGRVFTRSQIVSAVHGDDYPVTDRSIDVQIVAIRKILGEYGSYIETVRGVGYRFSDD
ncbi:MAG: response regulator [Candidatus Dadabacteria bacterium]|nr:MAG: response regulator [Candidatus Dadabacteria bacterium]